jgi:hypothetical protein
MACCLANRNCVAISRGNEAERISRLAEMTCGTATAVRIVAMATTASISTIDVPLFECQP